LLPKDAIENWYQYLENESRLRIRLKDSSSTSIIINKKEIRGYFSHIKIKKKPVALRSGIGYYNAINEWVVIMEETQNNSNDGIEPKETIVPHDDIESIERMN
jgi:hypothetical protein